jgi:hypothetical protein
MHPWASLQDEAASNWESFTFVTSARCQALPTNPSGLTPKAIGKRFGFEILSENAWHLDAHCNYIPQRRNVKRSFP